MVTDNPASTSPWFRRHVLWALLPVPVVAVLPETSLPGVGPCVAAFALMAVAIGPPHRGSALPTLLLLLAFLSLLSITWSVDTGQTVFTVLLWLGGIATVLAAPGSGPPWRVAVTAGVAVASVLALHQWTTGFADVQDALNSIPEAQRAYAQTWIAQGRVHGPFSSPDTLAGFLVATLPTVVVLAAAPSLSVAARACSGLVALAGLLGLVLTRSAGGALSLGAAVVMCGGTWLFMHGRKKHVVGLATAALAMAVVVWRLRQGEHQVAPLHAASERADDWLNALHLMAHHPWLGVGAGAYESAFNAFSPQGTRYSAYAHNATLQLGVELGLMGMALSVALYGYATWWALKHAARGTWMDAVLSVGVLAACLHHHIDYDLHVLGGLGLFIAMAGIHSQTVPPPSPAPTWFRAVSGVLAVGAVVLTVASAWNQRGIPRLPGEDVHLPTTHLGAALLSFDARAQLALAADLALAANAPDGEDPRALLDASMAAAQRAQELTPWLPFGSMVQARTAASRGDLATAMAAYDIAIRKACCSARLHAERRTLARSLGQHAVADEDERWLKEHARPWELPPDMK